MVSRDGYILTNAHVVSENGQAVSTVTVIFKGDGSPGTQVEGTVLGADESTDVALIKVDPSQTPGLEPIPLGDSSTVTVGEEVVAIGNPLGLDFSLSSGVVSAIDRELQSPSGATISGGIAAAGRTADRGPALARVSQDWYHYLSAWRPLSTAPAHPEGHARMCVCTGRTCSARRLRDRTGHADGRSTPRRAGVAA